MRSPEREPKGHSMKAAALLDGHDQLSIVAIDHDQPGPREALVQIEAVGLCHSDYHYIDRTLDRPRPVVLGHEAVGRVTAVGRDVTAIKVGDRVITCLVVGCGACPQCLDHEPTGCSDPNAIKRPGGAAPRLTLDGKAVNVMANIGAMADYALLDERALTVIGEDIPAHLAAIVGCAVVTGVGAVLNVAKVQRGETVAVIGCGGVGLNVIQGARLAGASRIIAVDLSPAKLALAEKLGATHVIDASSADAVAAVQALGGVDHAFEVIGRPATVAQALDMVKTNRAAYVVGVMGDAVELNLKAIHFRRGKKLIGVFMGGCEPRRDIPRYIEFWRQGRLDLETMVSGTVPLEKVNEGFAAMLAGEAARTVVVM
jgi:S-(hydroxymethyl)glutathione dehydrogenase / alcohol dehydrogenase